MAMTMSKKNGGLVPRVTEENRVTTDSAELETMRTVSRKLVEVFMTASVKSCASFGIVRSADVKAVRRAFARKVLAASEVKREIEEREEID